MYDYDNEILHEKEAANSMRFATWNMQGGVNTVYIPHVMNDTGADVICLQECGELAQFLQNRSPIFDLNGAIIGYTGNLAVGHKSMSCVFWENNAWIQGGIAVLSNVGMVHYGILVAAAVPGLIPQNVRNLPWMVVTNPNTGVNINIFSIHGPPIAIALACAWDNAQIAQIALLGGSWVCLGDFNADPTVFGYVLPPVGNVISGNDATQQGGGTLDYAVTNAGGFTYSEQTQLVGASDHYPQVFDW